MDYNQQNHSEWGNGYDQQSQSQQPGQPPYSGQPGQPPYQQPYVNVNQVQPSYQQGNSGVVLREVGQERENKMATTALILGIITLVLFWVPILAIITGILGVIFAILGLVREDRKLMPIIGMILSIVGLALSSLMIIGYIVQLLAYSYY